MLCYLWLTFCRLYFLSECLPANSRVNRWGYKYREMSEEKKCESSAGKEGFLEVISFSMVVVLICLFMRKLYRCSVIFINFVAKVLISGSIKVYDNFSKTPFRDRPVRGFLFSVYFPFHQHLLYYKFCYIYIQKKGEKWHCFLCSWWSTGVRSARVCVNFSQM